MNARGETVGRVMLCFLGAELALQAINGVAHQAWFVTGVFICGYLFGIAPSISKWIEEKSHEGDSQ